MRLSHCRSGVTLPKFSGFSRCRPCSGHTKSLQKLQSCIGKRFEERLPTNRYDHSERYPSDVQHGERITAHAAHENCESFPHLRVRCQRLSLSAEGKYSQHCLRAVNSHRPQLQLLAIRLGPGAAILPKNIDRLHMDFAIKIDDGHRGPR